MFLSSVPTSKQCNYLKHVIHNIKICTDVMFVTSRILKNFITDFSEYLCPFSINISRAWLQWFITSKLKKARSSTSFFLKTRGTFL